MNSKTLLKSFGAILAAFLVVFIISFGTDYICEYLGILPPFGQALTASFGTGFALFYRTVYDIFGSYLAARLAPNHAMRHALIVGAIGFVLSILGALALGDMGPAWYAWGLVATVLPGAWLGGKLFELTK